MQTMQTRQPLLELKNLSRAFPAGGQSVTVLKQIDLAIHCGEMVAIVGASGSGKSTLMNILGCLDRPTEGSYSVAGRATGTLAPDALAQIKPMPVDRELMAAHLDEWMKYWDANIRNRGQRQ